MEQKLKFKRNEQLDLFIQKSLDKFFFVEPWKKLYDRAGELHRDIISDKSIIPDLIIYNKSFNKVDCYFDCKKKLLINYPRKRFQLKPKYKKEYNPSSTYGDENEISFYINKVPNELSKNEINKSLNINKEKNKYSEISNEDKNREDDDEEEPEWANDNVEDYSNSKIVFKAIPKSLEEKMSEDIELSKDKISKNNVDIDEFFNNYDNNLNIINPIKNNKNNDIYNELKEFMSNDYKNNNGDLRNDFQNKLYDKISEKNNPHFNKFENHSELKDIFNNERYANSTNENNPINYNTYNYNLNQINDLRLFNIANNENKNKILKLQNIYQKYKMAQMYNYINYLKALNNIIDQPSNIQYNNNLFPQNQIPIFNNQNNEKFDDLKYLNNYNFQNLENFPNSNINNNQFINRNIWTNTPNSNLYNNFNEFNNSNIFKYNLIKHNMNNMNDINNRNKVIYVNNLNNIIFNAQKCQNNSNTLNFGTHQKLSGNFNNIKYNHLNNNLNQIIPDNEIFYKNFDNVKNYNNNINNINNKSNINNHIINIPNNLFDNREMINEQIKLENDLKLNAQNKYEKENIDLNPADYLENPMLILVKNIKKKNWLVFNNEGNVLNNYNSEELYYFLDEKNNGDASLEGFTVNDFDTDIMFPAEFIYNYLKKYYSK